MLKPDFCKDCPLYEKGAGYVPSEGPPGAKVLLIGEAPGRSEASEGRPFVGGSGRVLNMLLMRAGVPRSSIAITNICRCRPPKNRTPKPEEALYCMRVHKLREGLKDFNLIVLAGNTPLHYIAGRSHITRWRGSVFVLEDGTKVMPILHPAAIMRRQQDIPITIADLKKVNAESWTREWQAPKQAYELNGCHTDIQELIDAGMPVAFDVETSSLDAFPGSVTELGMGNQTGYAFVLDRPTLEGCTDKLQQLFSDPRVIKIGHNVMFDIGQLEAQGIKVVDPIYDTMIAHHLLLSDSAHDLGFVASLYTRIPYWKDLIKTERKWYNATDVDATFRIFESTAPMLKEYGMERIFETSMKLLRVTTKMKRVGVRVDRKLQLRWKVGLERRIKALETQFIKAVGDSAFNWRSNKQLTELLYDKWGLPVQTSRYSGGRTANEEALQKLFKETRSPLIHSLLRLRKLSKLSSTYFTTDTTDEFVHSSLLLHGTATGRLASRGPNLQNVPEGPARAIYIPREGNLFTGADYSQIELKIAAVLSGEETLLNSFAEGEDIHRRMAAGVFGVRYNEVTKEQRHIVKMIVYGLQYGRGAASLARQLKMSTARADRYIQDYFLRYPKMQHWRRGVVARGKQDGYLANVFGRRRYFFGPQQTTQMYNFLPQSTAADVIHEAMVRVDQNLPKGAFLVMQIHDELVVEHRADQTEEVSAILRKAMETPVDVLGGYAFSVDVHTGANWSELK